MTKSHIPQRPIQEPGSSCLMPRKHKAGYSRVQYHRALGTYSLVLQTLVSDPGSQRLLKQTLLPQSLVPRGLNTRAWYCRASTQPITTGLCVQNPVPRSSEPQNLELQSLLPGTQEPHNTVWYGRAGHPRAYYCRFLHIRSWCLDPQTPQPGTTEPGIANPQTPKPRMGESGTPESQTPESGSTDCYPEPIFLEPYTQVWYQLNTLIHCLAGSVSQSLYAMGLVP